MFRTNCSTSNDDSSFGSKGYLGAGLVALLVAAGCSAASNQGTGDPGLSAAGAAGMTAVLPPGAGGSTTTVVPPNGGGVGNTPATTTTTPPYNGQCPSDILTKCKACHDGRGTAGTPMGLMTWEDFHAPSHSDPSKQVYQILSGRLHTTKPTPMPPDGPLDPGPLATVDAWTAAGAPYCTGFTHATPPTTGGGGSTGVIGGGGAGNVATTGGGGVSNPNGGTTGVGGTTMTNVGGAGPIDPSFLSPDGSYFIKAPPGNTPVGPDAPGSDYCFNVLAHNAQTPLAMDPSSFQVKPSEFYHSFQQKVSYTKPFWALSTKPIIDNNKVLHHWLLFQMGGAGTDGSHADEIGLQLNNSMLTGWAPGGDPLDMPADVGLEMPAPGGFLTIEFHYYNTTGATAMDRSGVRVCGTYTQPTHPASLTWLGTETISIPANAPAATASGTCSSWKKNGDVHFIQTVPHMHKLGAHMKTVINRGGSTAMQDIIVDKPFQFADQRAYPIDIVAHSNDTFTTTCTWDNTTPASVGFGTSTTSEMCYNFVVYWPAHALDGVGGIEGSTNMCLF